MYTPSVYFGSQHIQISADPDESLLEHTGYHCGTALAALTPVPPSSRCISTLGNPACVESGAGSLYVLSVHFANGLTQTVPIFRPGTL